MTLADIEHFAEFTGDTFYAHTDQEAAAANPLFGGIVAHGYLVVSLAAGLFVDPDPGPVLANFGVDNLRFLTPVKADDTIAVTLTVKQITPRTNADYGEVRWDAVVTNAGRRDRRDVRRADAGRQDLAAGLSAVHRITIQYAAPADAAGFDAHYRDVHVPLASKLPGLRRFTLSRPRALGPGDAPYLVAELWFDDADAMKAALKSAEMAETAADAQADGGEVRGRRDDDVHRRGRRGRWPDSVTRPAYLRKAGIRRG